ncbi:MAG: tetratricopeptide repeat protein, partial [Gemmatimonadota bacterium]
MLPWQDRPDPRPAAGAPRSSRDADILRALAERIPSGDAAAHNNLGVVYFQKGLLTEAVAQFEHALQIDPILEVAERNLQIAYFTGDFYDVAVRRLHATLARDPTDMPARRRLARMYLWGGDAAAALRELHQLRNTSPHDVGLWHEVARAEERTGDLDAALQALAEADRVAPGNARTGLRMGEVLYRHGHLMDAKARIEAVLEADGANAEAHHLLARVLDAQGESDAARREAGFAASLNPAWDRADGGLALDAREEREAAAARELGVAETGTLARYNVGIALRQKGRYEEAEEELESALQHGEDPFLVRQALAELQLLRGDEEAVSAYADLLDLEPASPKLWNELGVSRHLQGRLAEAQEAYERALALDAGYALAWNNLGVVRHDRGEGDPGAAFESALQTGRALAEVWRNFGWLRHRGQRTREAEQAYRRALDADPESAGAWTGLG